MVSQQHLKLLRGVGGAEPFASGLASKLVPRFGLAWATVMYAGKSLCGPPLLFPLFLHHSILPQSLEAQVIVIVTVIEKP